MSGAQPPSSAGAVHRIAYPHGWPTQALLLEWGTRNQLSEFTPGSGGSMVLAPTNVYAGRTLMATYDANNLHFYLNDDSKTRVDVSRDRSFRVDATNSERRP